jgi:putative transposase
MNRAYDPQKHHRRSIRLRHWDYRSAGVYFITICTHQRQYLFDETQFRNIAEVAWQSIPNHDHAARVQLDEWIVMPNHFHGLLVLAPLDDKEDAEPADNRGLKGPAPGSIGAIVGNFKSLVSRRINNLRRTTGAKVWQRGYYDRIIRDERHLNITRQYIRDNPRRWAEDRENLDRLLSKMRLVL